MDNQILFSRIVETLGHVFILWIASTKLVSDSRYNSNLSYIFCTISLSNTFAPRPKIEYNAWEKPWVSQGFLLY